MRGLLGDALAGLQREHEAQMHQLRTDNKRLHHALGVARSREAELEEKLRRASDVMIGLQQWSKQSA